VRGDNLSLRPGVRGGGVGQGHAIFFPLILVRTLQGKVLHIFSKFLCNLSVTLQNFMRVLQINLFRTCSLQELFEPPGQLPNNMCVHNQLTLALA